MGRNLRNLSYSWKHNSELNPLPRPKTLRIPPGLFAWRWGEIFTGPHNNVWESEARIKPRVQSHASGRWSRVLTECSVVWPLGIWCDLVCDSFSFTARHFQCVKMEFALFFCFFSINCKCVCVRSAQHSQIWYKKVCVSFILVHKSTVYMECVMRWWTCFRKKWGVCVCACVRQNAPLLATVSATRLMYTLIMEMMFWKATWLLFKNWNYNALQTSSAWWNKLLNISLQQVRTLFKYTHTHSPILGHRRQSTNRLTVLQKHL